MIALTLIILLIMGVFSPTAETDESHLSHCDEVAINAPEWLEYYNC